MQGSQNRAEHRMLGKAALHLPPGEFLESSLCRRDDLGILAVEADPPEIAHDRVVTLDLEVAGFEAEFADVGRHLRTLEMGVPGERCASVQVGRRIVRHFAQREPTEVRQTVGVLGGGGREDFTRHGHPLAGGEGQIPDTVCHGSQNHRVMAGTHTLS